MVVEKTISKSFDMLFILYLGTIFFYTETGWGRDD